MRKQFQRNRTYSVAEKLYISSGTDMKIKAPLLAIYLYLLRHWVSAKYASHGVGNLKLMIDETTNNDGKLKHYVKPIAGKLSLLIYLLLDFILHNIKVF